MRTISSQVSLNSPPVSKPWTTTTPTNGNSLRRRFISWLHPSPIALKPTSAPVPNYSHHSLWVLFHKRLCQQRTLILDMQFDPVNLYKPPPLGKDVAIFNFNFDVTSYTGLIIGKNGKVSHLNCTAKMERSLPNAQYSPIFSLAVPWLSEGPNGKNEKNLTHEHTRFLHNSIASAISPSRRNPRHRPLRWTPAKSGIRQRNASLEPTTSRTKVASPHSLWSSSSMF